MVATSAGSRTSSSSGYVTTEYSYEPSADSPRPIPPQPTFSLKTGNSAVVVASGEAKLMCGRNMVGAVPQGTHVSVGQVQGDWAWTSVEIEGRKVAGWIAVKDLGSDKK